MRIKWKKKQYHHGEIFMENTKPFLFFYQFWFILSLIKPFVNYGIDRGVVNETQESNYFTEAATLQHTVVTGLPNLTWNKVVICLDSSVSRSQREDTNFDIVLLEKKQKTSLWTMHPLLPYTIEAFRHTPRLLKQLGLLLSSVNL